MTGKKHLFIPFLWLLYALACLWLALFFALKASQAMDYGYGYFYDVLDIDVHIQKYAPQHPYKRGFEQLPKEQHVLAFVQIADSVHGGGLGLKDIEYRVPGKRATRLLDKAEITHLQDVASLLNTVHWLSLGFLIIWCLSAWAVARYQLPSLRMRALAISCLISLMATVLLVFGPKAVFYQMHIWIFPPQNQWFFYWNDSLMSTLMKAPDLFGAIAVLMVTLSLPLLFILYMLGLKLMRNVNKRT
jgi:hypothetical protein